jgi:hypothetical protein
MSWFTAFLVVMAVTVVGVGACALIAWYLAGIGQRRK